MHLLLLLSSLAIAIGIRMQWQTVSSSWVDRLSRTLSAFLIPPLLILSTALAIAFMGTRGQMPGLEAFSFFIAVGVMAAAGGSLVRQIQRACRSLQAIANCPVREVMGESVRVMPIARPFAACAGFWRSQLTLSQGLLDALAPHHLEAVLWHERAHARYRDPFWFFWLGWMRRLMPWLPQTEALWQELLVLRELRADRWAARHTDSLVLAEALLQVASTLPIDCDTYAAFGRDRLEERIDALLAEPDPTLGQQGLRWCLPLFLSLLPLTIVPFHFMAA